MQSFGGSEYTKGSSSSSSSTSSDQPPSPRPPFVVKPPENQQRLPSAYNRFMRYEIQRIKRANPEIPHREALSEAAKNWEALSAAAKNVNSSRRNLPLLYLFVPRMQLLDFPQQLLHKILLFLACNSFRDLHKAKAACKTFKNVIEEDVFFKEVDLFLMAKHEWYVALPQLTEFRLLCLELGNPSAIYMRGMWDYFYNGNLEEGLEAIRVAAEKGYDVAKYTYAMIRRIMTHNAVFDSPLINNLSRDFYTQTRRKIIKAENGIAWVGELPPLFEEKLDLISTAPLHCCECAPYTNVFYSEDFDERVKGGIGSPMCDRCFWIIQSVSFSVVMLKKVFNWP